MPPSFQSRKPQRTLRTQSSSSDILKTDRIAFLCLLGVLRGSNQQTTEDTEDTEPIIRYFLKTDRIAFLCVLSVLRGSNQETTEDTEIPSANPGFRLPIGREPLTIRPMATSLAFPFTQATSAQRRTLVAAALGWMLDAFDAMLYALVLAHVMRDLGMTKGTAGLLNSLTLLASGIGGVGFGFIADRLGRKRALMLSILTYSICSFASGLATSVLMLAVFRFILGLGMGGEWNTGATLVAETWPTELRAKAISIVQSSWAIGYALAALAVGIVLHYADWRMAFFVGILPALVVLWMRRGVPESEMWRQRELRGVDASWRISRKRDLPPSFKPPYGKHTWALLFMNFFGMFAWWGLFTWIPPYLLYQSSKADAVSESWVRPRCWWY